MNYKPGDVIKSPSGKVSCRVTECVDGHVWGFVDFIEWECCWRCSVIRRRDKQNKPCRGPHGIGLRATEENA